MNDTLATLEAALVESAIRWYQLHPITELAKPGTLTRAVQDVLAERRRLAAREIAARAAQGRAE